VRNTAATTVILATLTIGAAATTLPQRTPKPSPKPAEPPLTVVWRQPLPVLAERPGAPTVVANANVVVVSREDAGLFARAASDGSQLWSASVGSVVPPVLAGERIVVASQGTVRSLALNTGDGVWQVELDADPSALLAIGDQAGAVLGGEMRLWDAAGTPVWRAQLGGTPATPVVSRGGVIYAGLDEPSLVALDAASGSVRWRVRLPARPESLTVSDDRLYLAAADGALYSFKTSGESDPAWRYPLLRAIGEPSVDDRFVYYALLDNSVRAFDRHGGSQRWSRIAPFGPSRPMTGPMDAGPSVAVALTSGQVVEFSRAAGDVITPHGKEPATETATGRLQAAAASSQAQRIYTVTIAKDYTSTLTAWGRAAEKH
jgi:outer membrane protein assembly factor BamB